MRLPIFPLPELTFFPHTLLPLHIFETRYRQMMTDVLAGGKRLAVGALKPGWEAHYEGKPEAYPVATVGEVIRWERLASGRYNILLQGIDRVRIEEELPTDTLYRLVNATVLEDLFPNDPATLDPLVDTVKRLALKLVAQVRRDDGPLSNALSEAKHAGIVADRVAAALIPEFELRQRLLETVEVKERLDQLAEALDRLLSMLKDKNDQDTAS